MDKETYAANTDMNKEFLKHENYQYIKCDIAEIKDLPFCDIIANMAAESHVDNSIEDSFAFIKTNILGVYNLLEIVKNKVVTNAGKAWEYKPPLFYQCSTDEVFGDITDGFFKEDARHRPSNPYAAAKSAAEQLVVAWGRTYNLPYIMTRTTNNYGPRQHPEKLIPRAITNIREGKKVPIHGGGRYVRNWIHVEDNVRAIYNVLDKGNEKETYHIASEEEYSVKEVVSVLCESLRVEYNDISDLSMDRSGADVRYALNYEKMKSLGWEPLRSFKWTMHKLVDLNG
jgi:dTDP-glucose 4,6-dehydratase